MTDAHRRTQRCRRLWTRTPAFRVSVCPRPGSRVHREVGHHGDARASFLRRVRVSLAVLPIVLASCDASEPLAVSPGWDWSGSMTVPTLSCSSQVAHLATATCFVSPPGEEDPTFGISNWSFVSNDNSVVVQSSSSSTSWSGKMVVSGTVKVQGTSLGSQFSQEDHISVTRRSWSWSGSIGGRRANPGEIDACVGSTGLTSGKDCSAGVPNELFSPAPSGGYSISAVNDDGPNDEVRYLTSATVTMQLRSQINKKWRSDGDTLGLPMTGDATVVNACGPQRRNHHYVNTVCAPDSDFGAWVNYVWNHEDLHRAEALNQGTTAKGDLHALWEPLVSKYPSTLTDEISDKRQDAKSHINGWALCTHTGTNPPAFQFWLNFGSGWTGTSGMSGDETKPSYC